MENNNVKPEKRGKKPNNAEDRTIDALDRLAVFEHFENTIAPAIRADLAKGLTADELYTKYETFAAARAVTIIATEPDSSKALSAIKDVLDRKQGKAVERKETTHRLAGLSDNELQAYLATKLNEASPRLLGQSIKDETEEELERESSDNE